LDSLQVFNSLLFEYDTYRLSGMGQGELDSLYQFLSTDSNLLLEVAGHTDGKGPDRYNQKLSERRCLAVVNYLEALGMAPGRIQWKGYGASRPVASNETEDGRSRNRRVEFRILREAPKIESLQN
jgi:outer membrane protein OmpA-like peptidoglycan-associated protein